MKHNKKRGSIYFITWEANIDDKHYYNETLYTQFYYTWKPKCLLHIRNRKKIDFKLMKYYDVDATERHAWFWRAWQTISRDHAHQKHNEYDHAAEDLRVSSTFLIFGSTQCVLHN